MQEEERINKVRDKLIDEINGCKGRLDEINDQIKAILGNYKTRQHLMDLNKHEKDKSKVAEKISIYKKVLGWME